MAIYWPQWDWAAHQQWLFTIIGDEHFFASHACFCILLQHFSFTLSSLLLGHCLTGPFVTAPNAPSLFVSSSLSFTLMWVCLLGQSRCRAITLSVTTLGFFSLLFSVSNCKFASLLVSTERSSNGRIALQRWSNSVLVSAPISREQRTSSQQIIV